EEQLECICLDRADHVLGAALELGPFVASRCLLEYGQCGLAELPEALGRRVAFGQFRAVQLPDETIERVLLDGVNDGLGAASDLELRGAPYRRAQRRQRRLADLLQSLGRSFSFGELRAVQSVDQALHLA